MALTKSQKALLKALKRAACELGDKGKELTSLIGELSACELLPRLKWEPSAGYDARERSKKVQIKTRRPQGKNDLNPNGYFSKFIKRKFKNGKPVGWNKIDKGMFVELDGRYEVVRIWEMSAYRIRKMEEPMGLRERIRIGSFRKKDELLYEREENRGSQK